MFQHNKVAIQPAPLSAEGIEQSNESMSADPPTLLSILAIAHIDHNEQARALHTIQRGVNALMATNPGAQGLLKLLSEVQVATAWVDRNKRTATSAKRGETSKAAVTQPAPSLPPSAHKPLLETWGLIVFAHWQTDLEIPETVSSGWRKLAEARLSVWRNLALLPLSTPHGIEAAIRASTSEVCQHFLHALLRLHKETTFTAAKAAPVTQLSRLPFTRLADVAPEPTAEQKERGGLVPPGSPPKAAPANELHADAEPQVKVDGRFIPWQLVAVSYLAGVDGYGLPHRWQALHPLELARRCKQLTQLLTSTNESGRLVAATCFAALFLGLPPSLARQVQFCESGDTWIDLTAGCIKRNLGAIATRKDDTAPQEHVAAWRCIYLPPQVVAVLLECIQNFPDVKTVGELLDRCNLTTSDIFDALNGGDQTSHRPELARFAGSLGLFLVNHGVQPAVAAQVSADWSLCPATDHYYLAANDEIFLKAVTLFCDVVGLQRPRGSLTSEIVGSPYCGSIGEISLIFKAIAKDVASLKAKLPSRSRVADFIHFQNFFQLACALHFVFFTGHRGSRLEDAKPDDIDLNDDLAMVRDKESDEYSARRLIPLIRILAEILKRLLAHQTAVILHLKKLKTGGEIRINADFERVAERHLFYQIKVNKRTKRYFVSPIKTADLSAFLNRYTSLPVNFGRHFGFTSLVFRDTAAAAINALSGRHTSGAETFGALGSLSPLDICTYLLHELETIFKPLEAAQIAGMGSGRDRQISWKPKQPSSALKPPVNDYLQSKLDAQDLQPTARIHVQRCPFADETLGAHGYISQLRSSFTKSDLRGVDTATAVLFCMIVFDMVAEEVELLTLFNAVVLTPVRVGVAVFAQYQEKGYTLSTRTLSPITTACVLRLRAQGATVNRGYSTDALTDLLAKLDPGFVRPATVNPWTWLMTSAMHFCLIRTAPTEQFSVLAGARSLSAEDVARCVHQRPAQETQAAVNFLSARK
ncbi:MAG: hypothetical protein ACRD98_01900, partial [Nitrososphaera sp.]